MNAQILFSGYYGLGNAGDEAVLDASVELFRRERPTLALSVLSGNVAETQRRLRLRAVPRFHPVAVLAAVRASDLVLSGGGSLLQDRTSMKSLLYYLSVLILAKRLGKK
ncbi:MAG: polysaccharide pyruvyl transferase CsaB, partial [Armatimonadetes bacterium]|nr:polysaccharide pyruvyl transferase CsaB [Armatimonadota bacterium]